MGYGRAPWKAKPSAAKNNCVPLEQKNARSPQKKTKLFLGLSLHNKKYILIFRARLRDNKKKIIWGAAVPSDNGSHHQPYTQERHPQERMR